MIKQAVILVAGESKRMHPLTERVHKCMLYVSGKPLIAYLMDIIKSNGIKDVVVVIGHGGDNIKSYLLNYYKNFDIKFVTQEKRLGTAHAIQQAEKYVNGDFLVLNGDILFEPELLQKVSSEHNDGCITMVACHRDDPENFGVLEIKDDKIVRIHEKPKNPPSNVINAGIYVFPKRIFDTIKKIKLSPRGEYEITDAIQLLLDEKICSNFVLCKHRFEMSTPQDYKNASNWVDKYLKN